MAVKVPAGENNEIVFNYMTPGLKLGMMASVASVSAFVIYIITCATVKLVSKKRRATVAVADEEIITFEAQPFITDGETVVSDEELSFMENSPNIENTEGTEE